MSEMTHFPMLHCVALPPFDTQQVELVQTVSCHCVQGQKAWQQVEEDQELVILFICFIFP